MKKLITLLLFVPFLSFSQERTVFFGKIIDNLGELENVHIINTNTQAATHTNSKGEFRVFAKVNDSIKITSIGYKTLILILRNTDFGITEKEIYLEKEIIELDEVNLKKHSLLGSLSSDIKKVRVKKEINAKILRLPNAGNKKLTVAERRLYTAMGGAYSFQIGLNSSVSVDYIINSLSGRIKKLKKLKKIEDKEKQINFLKNSFTNYIVQDLNIDSTNVSQFIYYCKENKDYHKINSKKEFEIIEYLRDKSTEFKKLNKKK